MAYSLLIHYSENLRQIFKTAYNTEKLNIYTDHYNAYNNLIDEDYRPYEDCFEAFVGQMYIESKSLNEIAEVIVDLIQKF